MSTSYIHEAMFAHYANKNNNGCILLYNEEEIKKLEKLEKLENTYLKKLNM